MVATPPSAVITSALATGTGVTAAVPASPSASTWIGPIGTGLQFVLSVTAAATDAIDTLDVFVQTLLDGTNWVDVVHFTQVVGNVSVPALFVAKINKTEPTTAFATSTALGAAAVRHLFGDMWRCRWAIVDADANAAFTFTVAAASTDMHVRTIG